jgi:hypothetical protein
MFLPNFFKAKYKSMTKDQLKQICRDKNMKVSGNKNTLINQLINNVGKKRTRNKTVSHTQTHTHIFETINSIGVILSERGFKFWSWKNDSLYVAYMTLFMSPSLPIG